MAKLDVLSTKQVAEMLKVSDQTVINWFDQGKFPNAIRLDPERYNAPIIIPRSDVAAFSKGRRPIVGKISS